MQNWGLSNYDPLLVIAGVVLATVLLLRVAQKFFAKKQKIIPPVEIARIVEDVKFSDWGAFAVVALVAFNALMLFQVWVIAKNAIQEASVGTFWIAGNLLFGIATIIGRRRTYRVLRDQIPAKEERS